MILLKYGNTDSLEYHEYHISNQFVEIYHKPIAEYCYEVIRQANTNSMKKQIKICVQFLCDTIRIASFGPEIIPQCIELIKENLFQFLLLEQSEIENFEDNPIEFIHNNRLDREDCDTLKNAIIDFIRVIINPVFAKNPSLSYVDELFQFCVTHIHNTFENADIEFKVKDGLLVLLGTFSSALVASENHYKDLNKLFKDLCGFQDQSMSELERNILTYRILYIFEEYNMMDWEKEVIMKIARFLYTNNNEKTKCITGSLSSECECIKYQSAILLPNIITHHETIEDFEPHIREILYNYICLMEHNQNDIVVAFQDVFSYYEYCTLPYIIEICEHLYHRHLLSKGQNVYSCVLLLSMVIESVESYGGIVDKIEQKIIQLLIDAVNSDKEDCISTVIDCLSSLIRGQKEVSQNVKEIAFRIIELANISLDQTGANTNFEQRCNFTQICDLIETIVETQSPSLFSRHSTHSTLFDEFKKLLHKVLLISQYDYGTSEVMKVFSIIKLFLSEDLPVSDALEDFIQEISIAISKENLNHYQKLEITECFEACMNFDQDKSLKIIQKLGCAGVFSILMEEQKVKEITDEVEIDTSIYNCPTKNANFTTIRVEEIN